MKKHVSSRLLFLVLVLALVCSLAVPAMAAPDASEQSLSFEKVDTNVSLKANAAEEVVEESAYAPSDLVRVSIVMDKPATLFAGFSSANVASSTAAVSYRDSLKANQNKVTAQIEKALGSKLDVQWNLTLAANIISTNVKFGQIAEIEKVRTAS